MSNLERGLAYIEDFMVDQQFSHKVVANHNQLALELSPRIEASGIGRVAAIFGSGEFYRLLKFDQDGSFQSVKCNEILRHKRSLLNLELDEYNQLKNLPDLDLLVVVDEINFKGETKDIEKVNNFRLIYSDSKNIASNFPEILPFDIGMIGQKSFEKILADMNKPKRIDLETPRYLLIRANNSYSQSRFVQAWVKGFILNASVPLVWKNEPLREKYVNTLRSFAMNMSPKDWYDFLISNSNVWRSYYPDIYKEEEMKNIIFSRWQMFSREKGLKLT